jgi:tyrosyl-tRNA synthetase
MSKSLGNYVGIAEPPFEMYGKIMSISDELMWRYFELLSRRPLQEIETLRRRAAEGMNPRDIKSDLATEIVTRFHDAAAADGAQAEFVARHRDQSMPQDLPLVRVPAPQGKIGVAHLLRSVGLVDSTSEAFRLIEQGGVRIDGQRVDDRSVSIGPGEEHIVQVGRRRFARVIVD